MAYEPEITKIRVKQVTIKAKMPSGTEVLGYVHENQRAAEVARPTNSKMGYEDLMCWSAFYKAIAETLENMGLDGGEDPVP